MNLGENMHIKQLFVNLGMILALGALFLSVPTFATGEEEPDLPNQSENTDDADETEDEDEGGADDTENNSSDNSSIGGGLNADGNNHPAPSEPSQPDVPSVSKPLPQPEDPDTEGPQSTPSTPTAKPTLPTATLKPQVQPSRPNITATPVAPTPEMVDDKVASTVPTIPAAPNDNIAPTDIETPLTGIAEDQSTPANPLAIVLLILAGITIIAAGIISTLLSKVAQRNQSAI